MNNAHTQCEKSVMRGRVKKSLLFIHCHMIVDKQYKNWTAELVHVVVIFHAFHTHYFVDKIAINSHTLINRHKYICSIYYCLRMTKTHGNLKISYVFLYVVRRLNLPSPLSMLKIT